MRAVIQRVSSASISVEGNIISSIGKGLLVLAGVEKGDTLEDIKYIATKLAALRIFYDNSGKMNLDVKEAGGKVIIVSQFTLLADARKGRRPSFDNAEGPDAAKRLYEELLSETRSLGIDTKEGAFGAHMEVALVNDGPVTILLDSKKAF
ncbi:MAG: D-aminoacyl-tRNA deacylase [Deltaproteobacteria bacterium]|nr:D-aminoacyl-tRNA deacylase [Deltaproteobacteria bacterium]